MIEEVVVWMRRWLIGRGCCSLDEEVVVVCLISFICSLDEEVVSGSDSSADATCLSSSSDLVCSSAGGVTACLSCNISTDGPDEICIHTDQGNSSFGQAER